MRFTPVLAALAVLLLGAAAVVASHRVKAGTAAGSAVGRSAAADRGIGAAELPVGDQAPAVRSDRWLNSGPLGPAELTGKVVLYDFWTLGCVNCQHTLPYLKAWHRRYAADGLVVLGIHSPEFGYEADPANVADYVAREQIRYPVALDPDLRVWDAFDNRYWPAFYLHDRQGNRRWSHIGEGDYDQAEDAIRALLGVAPTAPRAAG
jgi:thiol-disulfide isomerase/thioredoxin